MVELDFVIRKRIDFSEHLVELGNILLRNRSICSGLSSRVHYRVAVEHDVLSAPVHYFDFGLADFHGFDVVDFVVIKHYILKQVCPL